MCISRSKLTVLFDAPFWVLLYEREFQGCYEACRIVFGAEPTDQQIYEYLMEHWRDLSFSPSIIMTTERKSERRINPKRRQREARKQTSAAKNHTMNTIGTKAQQALKLQREQGKLIRQTRSREQKQANAARKRKILENKHKEKHRGH